MVSFSCTCLCNSNKFIDNLYLSQSLILFNIFLLNRIKCGKSYFWQPSVNNLLTVSDKVENILVIKYHPSDKSSFIIVRKIVLLKIVFDNKGSLLTEFTQCLTEKVFFCVDRFSIFI